MRTTLGRAAVSVWLLALVGACGGETQPAGQPTGDASPAAEETGLPSDCVDVSGEDARLEARDNEWEPPCLGLAAGQDVTVTNVGAAKHSFTIADTDIDIDLDPDDEATAEAVGDAIPAGEEIEFFCKYHAGMVGYLNLVES